MVEVVDLVLQNLLYDLVGNVFKFAREPTCESSVGLELMHSFSVDAKDTIELLSETSPFFLQCSRFLTAVANAADLLEDMHGLSKLLKGATTHMRANAKISILVLKITQGLIKLTQGKFFFDPIAAFKGELVEAWH